MQYHLIIISMKKVNASISGSMSELTGMAPIISAAYAARKKRPDMQFTHKRAFIDGVKTGREMLDTLVVWPEKSAAMVLMTAQRAKVLVVGTYDVSP